MSGGLPLLARLLNAKVVQPLAALHSLRLEPKVMPKRHYPASSWRETSALVYLRLTQVRRKRLHYLT